MRIVPLDEVSDFISATEITYVSQMDLRNELNTYCSNRHEQILKAMNEIVDAKQAQKQGIDDLSNVFINKESTYNLELMSALNLLAIRRVFKQLRYLEPNQEYLDREQTDYFMKIVNNLKSSEFLSLSQFKEYSEKRTLSQLLVDINQMDMDNGISKLYNGDIVVLV